MSNHIFFITCLLVLFSCQTSKKKSDYQEIIAKELGQEYSCQFNSDTTYTLCLKTQAKSESIGSQVISFVVLDTKTNAIVFKDKLPNATISWVGHNTILVDRGLGYLNDENARERYVVDLKTLKRKSVSGEYKLD